MPKRTKEEKLRAQLNRLRVGRTTAPTDGNQRQNVKKTGNSPFTPSYTYQASSQTAVHVHQNESAARFVSQDLMKTLFFALTAIAVELMLYWYFEM